MSAVPKTKMRWRGELYSCCADLTAFSNPRTAFRFRRSRACGHIHRHSGTPTVIPDPPSTQPSFRRKPESRAVVTFTVIPVPPNRHSGASRNLGRWSHSPSFRIPQPSFRLPLNRHSGASRNPGPTVTFTVIPVPPNRHSGLRRNLGRWSHSPSFRIPLNRHSGASRNLCLPAPLP